ncbi:MAG: hypothetical protein HY534_01765, partial [Chloroflexi bacterium]|nr:hypothetical protein [Chloroflexota bacterium]
MATLITGLGYLGGALAARLLADHQSVVGIDNFFATPRQVIAPLEAFPEFRLIEGSISD